MEKGKSITFFIDDKNKKRILKIAEDSGLSTSSFIRFLVLQKIQEKQNAI
ncbi:hypothetical protein HOE04_02135 [archaeon]|jgi:antitoxin component of RelBE/YafQ-DinJ toxin-antitoxin module|nr:hypothetical protein [archaeon]